MGVDRRQNIRLSVETTYTGRAVTPRTDIRGREAKAMHPSTLQMPIELDRTSLVKRSFRGGAKLQQQREHVEPGLRYSESDGLVRTGDVHQ